MLVQELTNNEITSRITSMTTHDVERALQKEIIDFFDLCALVSPAAAPFLELMGQRVHAESTRLFGKTVLLYTPVYISDACENGCVYCSFNSTHFYRRSVLSHEAMREELHLLHAQGIRQVLLVTGEAPSVMSGLMIAGYCGTVREIMPSVGIEVQPLSQEEYRACVEHGADHLACYQETYDRQVYDDVHPYGRKRDFEWRYDVPERAAHAGMRSITLGVLLGLSEPRADVVQCALHARSIADRFPEVTVGFSLPRIRPFAGAFVPEYLVNDTLFVQLVLAYKLWMPHAVISISTRETASFRDALLPLGVTKMSAGSHTEVGGYAHDQHGEAQFVINDTRSIADVATSIAANGYQPVFKDWHVF